MVCIMLNCDISWRQKIQYLILHNQLTTYNHGGNWFGSYIFHPRSVFFCGELHETSYQIHAIYYPIMFLLQVFVHFVSLLLIQLVIAYCFVLW